MRRISTILLMLLLASCEKVNDQEMEYVGRWSWDTTVDEFREFGYLVLRENRTYSYHIEMRNPTESLILAAPDKSNYSWRLNDDMICISSSKASKDQIEEECLWNANKDSGGNPYISIDGSMTGIEIFAERDNR